MVYPFLSIFARSLGVDLTTFSYALTARSLAATFGPFAASVADQRGRRFGMALGAGLFTVGTTVVVFWPTFPGLAISLVLSTLGNFIFGPSMQAFLSDQIPYERRGRALAIAEFSWSLAFIAGVPLMGFLIASKGWLAPFPLLGILGVLIFIGLFLVVPKDTPDATSPLPRENFRLVVTSLPALTGLIIGLCAGAANEQVNLIFGVWLEDSFGLQIAALGAASAVIGAAELSAEGLVAGFVDRLGKTRALALGLVVNSLAGLSLPLLGGSEAGALVGLFFFYLSFEFLIVSDIPLMTEILPSARATLMAFNIAAISLGRAIGAFLAPRLYGWNFWAVAVSAALFNLLALMAVRRLSKEQK
jgi:predicted MFS family arabinose efflux permease